MQSRAEKQSPSVMIFQVRFPLVIDKGKYEWANPVNRTVAQRVQYVTDAYKHLT